MSCVFLMPQVDKAHTTGGRGARGLEASDGGVTQRASANGAPWSSGLRKRCVMSNSGHDGSRIALAYLVVLFAYGHGIWRGCGNRRGCHKSHFDVFVPY